jgi:ADP-heptose:LPS heptosyltransferase
VSEVDTKTRRVLVYRLGSLGDMVVALPALHRVARTFPRAERRLLTNFPVHAKAPAAAAVLGDCGLLHSYMRYAMGTRSVVELARLWWSIARWRPEVVVYLTGARGIPVARRDARFFRLCGVRRLVGVPLTEAMQRNFYGAETDAACVDDWEPEAARLARCIAELGEVDLDDAGSWDLRLSAEEREAAEAACEGIGAGAVAVSVGTKVQAKDWGRENWRALLERMTAVAPGRPLLLVGAAEEQEASEFAAAGWTAAGGGPVVNLCGRLTPRESAAALARAQLFVGHDSGPMHLAAAVGTPCVAIFAARNIPRQWFPYGKQHRVLYHPVTCAGCGLETCVVERKRCLTAISVDEALEVVSAMMDGDN